MDSFKALQESISEALVSTTRSATRISNADVPFQRSLNPAAGTALDSQNARLLHLAQRLIDNAAAGSDAVGPKLSGVDAIDDQKTWRDIVDVIDSLLEKADISLDEYTGVVKRLSPAADYAPAAAKPRTNPAALKHLPKPQLSFEHAPNNYETGGFRPLLTSKPHAKVPLEKCLQTFKDKRGREQYPHPYQKEIETYEYPPSLYKHIGPIPYQPWETTTATFVDTPEAVADMLTELKKAKEIAVDLEHHDNRSYIGMVSLMQISTRDKDWIVDTLKPWRRRLECLNEVFADPGIVKVLHGAYMDVIWLQRDLGLYIVGLFDTYHATRSLGYHGHGLAFLLSKFVKWTAQKQHQLADWRIRPLPTELFDYARADTHFLLYIFDNMRNELVSRSDFKNPEGNKVRDVLEQSKQVALRRYEHPVYDAEFGLGTMSWYGLVSKHSMQLTPQQFAVFKAAHKWRDTVAREQDESPLFIMPNHSLWSVARDMPVDKPALFSAVQHVSHILRLRADELILLLIRAKADGVNGPDFYVTLQRIANMLEAERPRIDDTPMTALAPASAPVPVASQPAPSVATKFTSDVPLRTTKSAFWGDLLSHYDTEQSVRVPDIDLALPLPPLTAEIFAGASLAEDQTGESSPAREKPTFIAKEDRPAEDERTDIFVVKQLGGRKRKRGDIEGSAEPTRVLDRMQDDEIILKEEETDSETSKRAKRAAKMAAKKAGKTKKSVGKKHRAQVDEQANENEPAFDYANAPDVLHAQDTRKKSDKKKGKKDKKKDAGFNPFSQLGNAPKGLPARQKESAGRSKTFSS